MDGHSLFDRRCVPRDHVADREFLSYVGGFETRELVYKGLEHLAGVGVPDDVGLADDVWPKFLRDNAVRVFKLAP